MKRAKRLLVIGSDSHYGSGVAEGIYRYCSEHGRWEYHLERDSSEESAQRSRFAIREWKADGIVACVQHRRILELILESGLPAVNVTGSQQGLPSVWADFPGIGRMIAEHLVGNGLRSFAFCTRTPEPQATMKFEGFSSALAEAGFRCEVLSEGWPTPLDVNWLQSQRTRARWLRKLKLPVGIMCTFDYMARYIALASEQLGLRVPEDVSIVGVQNEESVCRMCQPPLSSVEISRVGIGYEAARLVDRMIHGQEPPAGPTLVPATRLVTRQSSDIVALENREIATVIRFIRAHAYQPISIKDVLREVPISRRVMEQQFIKLIGRSPKSEIMRIRMNQATRLLADTDLTIFEVAQRSGFSSPETFTINFHRKMGITPTRYRRDCRTHGGFAEATAT